MRRTAFLCVMGAISGAGMAVVFRNSILKNTAWIGEKVIFMVNFFSKKPYKVTGRQE